MVLRVRVKEADMLVFSPLQGIYALEIGAPDLHQAFGGMNNL